MKIKPVKALAIVHGNDICQIRELIKGREGFAIYPLTAEFNKQILKENKAKVIQVLISPLVKKKGK